jgi:hypothetical protein
VQSYRLYDNALAWNGNLQCGSLGGWGINCGELLSGISPAGGSGCTINMGSNWNPGWHHLFMAHNNTDSYLYLCSAVQASSLGAMNHRYWFRKTKAQQ